jgi:hypothetical protein
VAAVLDAMGYRAHVFTDPETEADAVVYRAGPCGYRPARCATGPVPHTAVPPVLDPYPAPALTREQAVARLERALSPHLFFAEPDTGRGRLLYRRFDGHYGLVEAVA